MKVTPDTFNKIVAALRASFPETNIINEEDYQYANRFFRINLNPTSGAYGIFADNLDDALEILGTWCDDHAKGYIVDASKFTEEELEEGSYYFVNGSLECALDLNQCMCYMPEEYTFNLTFQEVRR